MSLLVVLGLFLAILSHAKRYVRRRSLVPSCNEMIRNEIEGGAMMLAHIVVAGPSRGLSASWIYLSALGSALWGLAGPFECEDPRQDTRGAERVGR